MSRKTIVSALLSMQCRVVFVLIFLLLSGCMDEPVPFDQRKGAGGAQQDQKADPNNVGGFIDGYWSDPENLLAPEPRESGTTPGIQSQKLEGLLQN